METNSKSEIVNQQIERYICIFTNFYPQNNWLEKLVIAAFTADNNKSVIIKLYSFFAIKNLYVCISFNIIKPSNASICEQIFYQKPLNISKTYIKTI